MATHIITTNRVKNISDEPRSRSPTITSTANPHATMTGAMYCISGRRTGPIFHVDAAISSRRSLR